MPDNKRVTTAIQVAKRYYLENLSQTEIAKELDMSRPTVSRLLQLARDQGLVQIKITDPMTDVATLEDALQDYFGIEVHVVPTESVPESEMLERVGHYAAGYLESITHDDDVIGIGWGKTLHAIATHLSPDEISGVQVVQLKGSVSYSKENTYAYESINAFATAFHTVPQYLPLPVIFDHQRTKELAEEETHIQYMKALGKQANTAIYSVGTVRNSALVFQLGYFNTKEQTFLQKHAVGDIFSRFIQPDGQIASPEINDRTIGIDLADLRTKEHSILVSTGDAKVPAVFAALKGGYPNCLIMDQHAAQELLNLVTTSESH